MSCYCPEFWRRDSNIYLVLSLFTSRPISLLEPIKFCVFFSLWYLYYQQVDSYHKHRPTADVYR
jgi:hypothetical protein